MGVTGWIERDQAAVGESFLDDADKRKGQNDVAEPVGAADNDGLWTSCVLHRRTGRWIPPLPAMETLVKVMDIEQYVRGPQGTVWRC